MRKNIFVLPSSWEKILHKELKKTYLVNLKAFLDNEKLLQKVIYPEEENIFHAFFLTPFDKVKVVIVGQDPYHGPGQAHGLCFSVPEGISIPPSLKNIYKELSNDIGIYPNKLKNRNFSDTERSRFDSEKTSPLLDIGAVFSESKKGCSVKEKTDSSSCLGITPPTSGCLTGWAKQGVLLLNATLTVRQGEPLSHFHKGWEQFTDAVIECIAREKENIVFLLWGKNAQEKCDKIISPLKNSHLVLHATHPSPFSAHKGFLGCRHFSKTNEYLIQQGKEPIHWGIIS